MTSSDGMTQREMLLDLYDAVRGDDGLLVRFVRMEDHLHALETQIASERSRSRWLIGTAIGAVVVLLVPLESLLIGRLF